MRNLFIVLFISLMGIGLLTVAMSHSYTEWSLLKTRNETLHNSIEKQKRTLAKLKNDILLASELASVNSTTHDPLNANKEHETLLRGYIKRGDHIIELILPVVSTDVNPIAVNTEISNKNWRGVIMLTYVLFIMLALLLFYRRGKS